MLRVASSTVVPTAFRAIATPKILSPLITNAFVSVANPRPLLSLHRFSAQSKGYCAHNQLVKALDSEIKTIQLISLRPAPPADFPFKIQHHSYRPSVTLTREFYGEEIEVRLLDIIDNGSNESQNDGSGSNTTTDSDSDITTTDGDSDSTDSDSDSCSDSNEKNEESSSRAKAKSVTLKVEIYNQNGKSMKFAACASADEIMIQRLTTKEGEKVICSQLYIRPEGELQMAFRNFLEVRGIEKSIADFLYDYMKWNVKLPDSCTSIEASLAGFKGQENVEILKKLKKVIEDW